MNVQTLLISSDDAAADVLGKVLPTFGIALDRSSDLETTLERIQQQKFDALIVDFEDQKTAEDVLQQAQKLGSAPLSIALVEDHGKVRHILNGGAHFVLYKPLTEEAASAGLRAAAAMLSRERRRAFRVPVQAPVEITLPDTRKLELRRDEPAAHDDDPFGKRLHPHHRVAGVDASLGVDVVQAFDVQQPRSAAWQR